MDTERWQRISELFDAAIERPRGERDGILAAACAGDEELRREVEALLESHDGDPDFLEEPVAELGGLEVDAGGHVDVSEPELLEGSTIGRYRTVRSIGAGGMGNVFLAERADVEFHQEVALKLVKRGMDTDHVLRRFHDERRILASLNHPNIGRLLDGGMAPDGRPYFVMEYIDGVPIDQHCERHRLPLRARLELFETVCHAVHYAHQNLVVHRDLKPSNILIAADGQAKLLDFGIAKILDPDRSSTEVTATRLDARALTPEYASPEQVEGRPITTATDVYSLGVLLYQLLTGERPHRFDVRTPDAIARTLRDTTARPPSQVGSPWRAQLRGELDTIIMMAMHHDPARRYPSAEELAADLRRYLGGHPVLAHKDSAGYRMRRFVKRHRLGVGIALTVGLMIAGFTVTSFVQWRRVLVERQRVEAEQEKTEQVVGVLVDMLRTVDPRVAPGTDETTVATLLETGERRIEELAGQPELQSELWSLLASIYAARSRYDRAEELLERALAVRKKAAGLSVADDPVAAGIYHELALNILKARGATAAEPLLRESLDRLVRVHGEEHINVAQAMQDLASVVSDVDERQRFLERVIELRRELEPDNELAMAASLNALASHHHRAMRHVEARPLYEEALAILDKLYPDGHPHSLVVRNNLAGVYTLLGEWETAERISREASEAARVLVGPETREMAASLETVAMAQAHQGRHAEAERVFREALAIWEAIVGHDHPRTASAIRNLGRVVALQGRYGESVPLFEQAIAISERIDRRNDEPGVHPLPSRSAAYMRGQLAMALFGLGGVEEAVSSARETSRILGSGIDLKALNAAESSHPHRQYADAQVWLGHMLLATGEAAGAESYFRQALVIRQRVSTERPAEQDPRVAEAMCGLGEALAAQGRVAEGAPLVVEAFPALEAWGLIDPWVRERAAAVYERLRAGEARLR